MVESCIGGNIIFKKLDDSIHKPYYDRMHKKRSENKSYHHRLIKRRIATVDPVPGALLNRMNLKRVNTRGMAGANKHTLMAALCYNLKKYLKFIPQKVLAMTIALKRQVQKTLALYFRVFSAMLSFQKCQPGFATCSCLKK